MYGIFTYIWVIFKANVGKYSIHGAYGTTIIYIIFYIIIYLSLSPVFSRRSRQTRREMNFPSGNQTWQWEIPYQSKVRIGRPSMNGGFSGAMFDNRMENDGNMSFSGMVRHDGMMGIG